MIWTKIKCFFGFCEEKNKNELGEKIEIQRAVDAAYKKEPIVVEIKREEAKTLEPVNTIVVAKSKADKADEETKVLKSANKKMKIKRSWYNNGKTQKLVPVTEVESLPKVWKKGKLPKGDI